MCYSGECEEGGGEREFESSDLCAIVVSVRRGGVWGEGV